MSQNSSRPKIVLVQSYEQFPDFRVFKELELLRTLDVDLHVVIWQHTATGEHIGAYPGVSVHRVKIECAHGMGARELLRTQPAFYRAAYRRLRDLRPDLVIAHNLDSALPAAACRLRTRAPVLYVAREPYHKVFRLKTGLWLGEAAGWLLDATVAHLSSRVMAVTPRMVKMYRHMGVHATWMPNCPAREFLEQAGPRPDPARPFTIGFVGTLRAACGIEEMWAALKILAPRHPGAYRLLLCGLPLGGFDRTLARMQEELPDVLDLRPPLNPAAIPGLYREIDLVFAFPAPTAKYQKYGLNVKIYEALATGVPVVMAATSENADFLRDVDAAVVLSSVTPEAIAAVVDGLRLDPARRQAMGERGRAFIRERFNWELFGPQYLRCIQQLLGNQHRTICSPGSSCPG